MWQAIATKYHGCTNTRGSRYSAKAEAGRVTTPTDYALNSGDNHARAARALAQKWGWHGEWVGGALPGGGYAFVRVEGVRVKADVAFTVEKAAKACAGKGA